MTTTKAPIKAAVIGAGAMGYNHLRVYADLEGVELVAVADVLEENLLRVKRFCANGYTDYTQMLEKERPDIVSVVVPTSMHKEVALAVIAHGCHLLVEKPLASTTQDSEMIATAAHAKGVKLLVGHIERFNPAVIELKRRLKEGQAGRIYKIDVNRIGPFPERIRDVGVVIDLALHDIDIARHLAESDVEHVYAETEKRINTDHEDLLSGLMKFKNKVICHLNVNWLTPMKRREVIVTAERGMFMLDYIDQTLCFYENAHTKNIDFDRHQGMSEGTMTRYMIKKREPLRAEIESLVTAVREGTEPVVDCKDAIIAIKLAQELIESANKGVVVRCK